MRYLCTNCNHIYDEALWDPNEGILPWTRFEELQDSFVCPVCAEGHDMFQEITEEVNRPINVQNLTSIEKEHLIRFELHDGKISVIVGQDDPHPMIEDHFIASIALYDEVWELIDEQFVGTTESPEAIFDADYLSDFEIRIRCNLHGVWSSGLINIDN
jgi:desulfoferrodoxin-like iron-binding protein